MRFLSVEQMRAADAAAAKAGLPETVLMERAGAALARVAAEVASLCGARGVALAAGRGNNGGDACVAARALCEAGCRARVLVACDPKALSGAALAAWEAMRAAGIPCEVLPEAGDWERLPPAGCGVVVDGLLGTGCSGAPRGASEQAIRWINRQRRHARIVAADLPSGLNGDTGEAAGAVVRADVTVTFARPKRGLLNPEAAALAGHVEVADIGIPDALCDRGASEAPCRLIARPELARRFPSLARDAHKGALGHVCVVGGSAGFPHAPALAALGALRSGAGLVTVAAPPRSAAAAAALAPEAILPALAGPRGELTADALRRWGGALERFDAVVAGPGLGQSPAAREVLEHLLDAYGGRLVLDADGLNALAVLHAEGGRPALGRSLLLTPHPGEAARLLGAQVREVQNDRFGAARKLAETFGAVVVLKGAGTVVCEPGGVPWLNLTGNPGMASGGTGDVLAGMTAALWARGLEAAHAACTAVWAHGAAGDAAALAESQTSLTATALATRLGRAFSALERGAE